MTNTIRDNGGDFSLRPSEIALARAAFRARQRAIGLAKSRDSDKVTVLDVVKV